MDQCFNSMSLVHLVLGVMAALNVTLSTWLAYRRRMADIREHKRNGSHGAQKSVAAESFEPSDHATSLGSCGPKE
jgi:hypothetical protein